MICIPWQLVFESLATKVMHFGDKKLPWFAWFILIVSVETLSAASYHLIEKPARERMKLMTNRRTAHGIATATAG